MLEQIITRFLCYATARRRSNGKSTATILAYHEISDLPRNLRGLYAYNVTPAAFSEQMEYLHSQNYFVMKLEDLISCLVDNREIPGKAVVITFDDGYKNHYTNAVPVLRRHNYPATIFLATDYIGRNRVFPWFDALSSHNRQSKESWAPLSWEEVGDLSEAGMTFGSHTCSHANLRKMSIREFDKEIEKSKKVIEEKIDIPVNLFSYPFSFPKYRRRYSNLIQGTRETLLRAGFVGACTTIIGTNSAEGDPFCLKRIQIKNTDDVFSFKAKVEGADNWVGLSQKMYQKVFEPLIEDW